MAPGAVACLTDVEGRWDEVLSFTSGNPHVSLVDGELRLAEGVTFVFGGDAIDRGAHGRRIVSVLLSARRRYGERVVLLAGNRDINKVRLVTELGGRPHPRAPATSSRAELLRWTLANTMGAAKAFDFRAEEQRETGAPCDDEAVVDSYLADLGPNANPHLPPREVAPRARRSVGWRARRTSRRCCPGWATGSGR